MNEGLMGLERHEGGVINDRIFIFGWTIPLRRFKTIVLGPQEGARNICKKNNNKN